MKRLILSYFLIIFFLEAGISQYKYIQGPPGSRKFGYSVTVLKNGNYVVSDPYFSENFINNIGAIYLYDGKNHTLISTLKGSKTDDKIGINGIFALSNGNFVVASSLWDKENIIDVGAVTWINGLTGFNGVVDETNSLTGTTAEDFIGSGGIFALKNGNYLVKSPNWNNGILFQRVGAVTWCDGLEEKTGVVNTSNSWYGGVSDYIGSGEIIELTHGNYVLSNPYWNYSKGAVTWGLGNVASNGLINETNSLVGTSVSDGANTRLIALNNNNFVVCTPNWNKNNEYENGAVTLCMGNIPTSGFISELNSYTGKNYDEIGSNGAIALSDGNFLIISPLFDTGIKTDVGAITWCNGFMNDPKIISGLNSIIGQNNYDQLGSGGGFPLPNNQYLISSPYWQNNGIGLTHTGKGAITKLSGPTSNLTIINSQNSIVGNSSDLIGLGGVYFLSNNNFILSSWAWNGYFGAITWLDSNSPIIGTINNTNSLIGHQPYDIVGFRGTNLSNGNFVSLNYHWHDDSNKSVGSYTVLNGFKSTIDTVKTSNSVVGEFENSFIEGKVFPLKNGDFIASAPLYYGNFPNDSGLVFYGFGSIINKGPINKCNSIVSPYLRDSNGLDNKLVFDYNDINDYLVVGKSNKNKISIYNPFEIPISSHLDEISNNFIGKGKVPMISSSGCRIISKIETTENIIGEKQISSKVWIEEVNLPNFVKRHYQFKNSSSSSLPIKVTLFFTQEEFLDFNSESSNNLKLPINEFDNIGISNIRIANYLGESLSGLPNSYGGISNIIDPVDTDILWNSRMLRWEISFSTTNYGGFFIQTIPNPIEVTISSILDGNWENPAIWSLNRVPNTTDVVLLNNSVVISTNAFAKYVVSSSTSNLEFTDTGNLNLNE